MNAWRERTAVPWAALVPALAAAALIVALLGFVVVLSFSKVEDGVIAGAGGLANYAGLFGDPELLKVLGNTLVFAAIALCVSFLLGVPLAWLAERSDLPGRQLIWAMMLSSLVIPGFLLAMGWLFLAHPRIGLFNALLMGAFHLAGPPLAVTTIVGMGIVQGLGLTSLTFVLVAPSLRAMDPGLEEAGRMAGASPLRLLREVTLPLVLPSLTAAAMYVAIVAIGAFDVPAIIGLSGRIYTFSTYLFIKAFPPSGFADYGAIAAGGSLVIVLALGMTVAYAQVLRRARRFAVVSGKAYRPRQVELGRWTVPAWTFVIVYALFALVLPFAITAVNAFLPFAQPLSREALASLSVENFRHIPWAMVGTGALHSLELVVAVPLLVVAFSVAISWIVVRSRLPGRFVLDGIAFLPHAVPGVLFGIGATLAALFILQKFIPIYGTVALVGIVYVIGWLSFGTRMINSSLIQIHPDLFEAAQVSGAGLLMLVREVIAPLLRPATMGLWIYVVLLCLRELTLAAFVTTPKNLTLPMVAWFLWTNGSLSQGAAVALIIVAVLVPLLFVYAQFGRRFDSLYQ